MSDDLDRITKEILVIIRDANSPLSSLKIERNDRLQELSLYDQVPAELKERLLGAAAACRVPPLDRAIGALVALAVADGIGHNFEFLPVQDVEQTPLPGEGAPFFEYPCQDCPEAYRSL